MGRPLNKKYFGNRNIGRNRYEGLDNPDVNIPPHNPGETSNFFPKGDDGIGGEGVDNITFDIDGGNYGRYLDRMPTLEFNYPSLPGGVQATGTIDEVQAVNAVVHDRGTGYRIGDIVRVTGGTGDKATFRVTKLRVVDIQLVEGASSGNFDGGENLVWDSLVDDNWTTPTVITNITSTGDPNYDISGWASWTGGVWDGYAGGGIAQAPLTLTITGGGNGFNTRGTGDTLGGTGDNNGSGGTVAFTYGIETLELIDGGAYTEVNSLPGPVSNDTVGAVGVDATVDVYYKISDWTITERGSGYISVADAAPIFSSINGETDEALAVAETILTSDIGTGTGYRQGNANNQENAIIAYAWQDGERRIADIVEQTGSKRFVCITNHSPGEKEDETVYGYLQAHEANGPKQIDIKATDYNGNTYFVTKMTAHKALLARRDQYTEGTTYQATGYIDNRTDGGDNEGETFHLVSTDFPGNPTTGFINATLSWTVTPTIGTAQTTVITNYFGQDGSGNATFYVPNAHVYFGNGVTNVAMTVTIGGEPAEWLFNDGDRAEWTFASNPDEDQVTIENA